MEEKQTCMNAYENVSFIPSPLSESTCALEVKYAPEEPVYCTCLVPDSDENEYQYIETGTTFSHAHRWHGLIWSSAWRRLSTGFQQMSARHFTYIYVYTYPHLNTPRAYCTITNQRQEIFDREEGSTVTPASNRFPPSWEQLIGQLATRPAN